MKNISYSKLVTEAFAVPVTSFLYRDTGASVLSKFKEAGQADSIVEPENGKQTTSGPSPQEVSDLLNRARVDAVAQTEMRIGKEFEKKLEVEAANVRHALELFQIEQKGYFSRVESEVVHLALAISAKILHREAQVDPLLVAALVRVAVDKLHDGSSVSVRVSPTQAEKWRHYLANPLNGTSIAVVEDSHLGPDDCILETDLGSANFSIDAQLREVEQGFFDLLAQRPAVK